MAVNKLTVKKLVVMGTITDTTMDDVRDIAKPIQRLCELFIGYEKDCCFNRNDSVFVHEFDQRRFVDYSRKIWEFMRSLGKRIEISCIRRDKLYDYSSQEYRHQWWLERKCAKGKLGKRYIPLPAQLPFIDMKFWIKAESWYALIEETREFTTLFVNGLKRATDVVTTRRQSLKGLCLNAVEKYIDLKKHDDKTTHIVKLIQSH